jgi:hypothetical protein
METFTIVELLSHISEHLDMMLDECRANGWIGPECEHRVSSLQSFLDLEILDAKVQSCASGEPLSPQSPADCYGDPLFREDSPDFHSECSSTCGCTLSPPGSPTPQASMPRPTPDQDRTEGVSMLRKLAENARKRRAG